MSLAQNSQIANSLCEKLGVQGSSTGQVVPVLKLGRSEALCRRNVKAGHVTSA